MFEESTVQRIATTVNAGARGAFGIQRREDDQALCLITRKRLLQVVHLRVAVSSGTGEVYTATEQTLTDRVALLDNYADGKEPQLVVFSSDPEARVLVSSDDASLSGYLLAVAAQPSRGGAVPYGVFAIFRDGHGAVLADSSPELIHSWQICTDLMGKGWYP